MVGINAHQFACWSLWLQHVDQARSLEGHVVCPSHQTWGSQSLRMKMHNAQELPGEGHQVT